MTLKETEGENILEKHFSNKGEVLSDLKRNQLKDVLVRQLLNLYGVDDSDIFYVDRHLNEAISRTLKCFSHIKNKYYENDNINVFHSGQYMIFLYYLANTIFRNEIKGASDYSDYKTEKRKICDKIYCLNKVISLCEVYYEIELPDYFLVDHPAASVIGRAKIGNGFSFIQGCTVGGNGNVYPIIGNNVFMYSNSKILGNCHVGNNVLIGANTYIKDMDIPDWSIVFGQYPNVIIKEKRIDFIMQKIDEQFYV